MKIQDFIPFLGHSPVNFHFDDCLLAAGLKGRPKGSDPTVFIKSADESFILGFSASEAFEEFYGVQPKTPGAYILVSIYAEAGSWDLPFGMDWAMSLDQLRAKLGEPRRLAAANATFLHENLHLVCRFADKTMRQMTSATLSLVDVYAKQRYGLLIGVTDLVRFDGNKWLRIQDPDIPPIGE